MCRFSQTAAWLSLVSLVTIAGCPIDNGAGDNNNNQTTPTTVVGTWTGALAGTTTQNVDVNDADGTPLPGSRAFTVKFNSNFIPTGIPIWGYNKAFDQTTVKNEVGASETFAYEANQPFREITLVATVREASYSDDEVRVVLDLEYSSTNTTQGLTEDGTGTMTFTAEVNGTSLTVRGVATYTITATANGQTTVTQETANYTGTLSKKSG